MKFSPTSDPKSSGAQPTWVVGPPVSPQSRIGSLIEGEYRIDSIRGEVELGVSYQAYNARLKRHFVVLMLERALRPSHEMMLAVRADLRRAHALSTLGLMPTKQVTDNHGIPGFATELLDGESLRQRLSRGPLSAQRALSLILHLAQALEAAHGSGLIHGDLRPDNIFLVRPGARSPFAGRAMLLKHSLHHLRRRPAGFDDSLPLSKLMYRPPEQVAGEVGAPDVSGDIFTLGGILHECLTGKPAFGGPDVESVLDHLARPPSLLVANPEIGLSAPMCETINVVISGACARDPQARIPTMADFVRALVQVAEGAGLEILDQVSEAPPALARGRVSRILDRLSGVFPPIAARRPREQPLGAEERLPVAPARERPAAPAGPEPAHAAAKPQPREQRTLDRPPRQPERAQEKQRRQNDRSQKRHPDRSQPRAAEHRSQPPRQTRLGLGPSGEKPAPQPLAERAKPSSKPPSKRATQVIGSQSSGAPLSARPTQLNQPIGLDQRDTRPPLPGRGSAMLPLSERSTRPMRARDIVSLVEAVQRGQLASSQAVERAREAEEIELEEGDLLQGSSVMIRSPPRPTAPMRYSFVPIQRRITRPHAARRFLLRHQEIVAALLGAVTILLLGLLLMRFQAGP